MDNISEKTDIYDRTRRLIGEEKLEKLRASHVLLFGLGGVGSYVCEALIRAGIGRLSLVDHDAVDITNLNRQLFALRSTLGMAKTEAARLRCRDIDPETKVKTYREFAAAEGIPELFSRVESELGPIDFAADAIDTVSSKLSIAAFCHERDIPLISCCGTGNKLHPELLHIDDIYKTSVCPLCRVMRKELKARGIPKLTVCYSEEPPVRTGSRTPASISFVPSAAGLLIASHIVNKLIAENFFL